MSPSDDYIIITESHNLGDEQSEPSSQEEDEVSRRTFESQGISILDQEKDTESAEPRDQLSRELMNEGGIEIISSEEESNLE